MRMYQQPRGSAIFLAMVMVVGALALLMGVLTMSTQNVTKHEQYSDREKNFLAAQGMLKTVFTDVWEPIRADPNYNPTIAFPNVFGAADNPWLALVADGQGNVYVGRKVGDCYISDVSTRWHTSGQNTPPTAANPIYRFFLSIRVVAQRTPLGQTNPDGTPFHLDGDVPAVVIETYELNQSSKSPVAQYVELAKNVSCSLCHTSFDNVFNYFNNRAYKELTNPANTHLPADSGTRAIADAKAKFGTFGRAKVASLGNFQMRDNNGPNADLGRFFPSDSSINGTFYSRGQVENQQGNSVSNIDPVAMHGVQFGSFNTVDTIAGINIAQDPTNWNTNYGMTNENMVPAAVVNGTPTKWQNLYLQYPTDPSKMSDGQVPLDFPFPFADVSGNKLVTDAAVTQKLTDNSTNKSSGITTPNITGSLSGGLAMVVSRGSKFADPTLPLATLKADGVTPTDSRLSDASAVNASTKGVVDGNLILIGTKDNPVNIDQQVIVKGDIIIKGYYTGVGSMWAQGNVYIPSDLQYKNAQLMDSNNNPLFDSNGAPLEDFGKAAGTHNVTDPVTGKPVPQGNENLGGLVAGGTIVIGDYLTASVSDSGLKANPQGGMDTRKYADGTPITTFNGAPVQTSVYVNNQPPDAFDTTQLPSGIMDQNNIAGRENGFPLVPTYQTANPMATYNYWQMDMTNGSASEGMYLQKSAPLFTKNFTLSQAEIFNRDQWAKTQPTLPASDGTMTQTNSTYDPAFVPRYYVLNRGDPVNAFIYGKQSSNPSGSAAQQSYYQADVNARKLQNGGSGGTFWDDTEQTFKGSESSKLYDTLTVGGATMDYSGVPAGQAPSVLPAGTGSLVDGKPTHLVYAPVDPTKPADPVTNIGSSILVDSTDASKAQKAAVIALNPDWIDPDKMWSIMLNEEWSRKSHDTASQAVYKGSSDTASMTNRDGTPFRIDGMLYTNNAIFGIQRNRTLAPQAPGDYQAAVQTDPATGAAKLDPVTHQPIPYTPDPTQPGPWQTLPPTTSSPNDYWQVTELQDVWSRTTMIDNYSYTQDVDNYSGTAHVDHYTRNSMVDHYTENSNVDNYTRTAYTDHYVENQYVDNYSRPTYQDHYTENQFTDQYARTAYTDHYTMNQYTDNYTRNQLTDHYSQTQYTDHYSKTTTTDVYRQTPYTQITRTWHCNKSTSYGEAYNGDVVQINPPTTFAQPTICNGIAVSSATYTDATTTISPAGTVAVIEPAAPPAGYTVLVGTPTSTTATSASAPYTGAAPAVPAGWTKGTTTSTVVTSVSAAYFGAPAPAVPAGFTLASTSTVTQTSTSAVYTGAPPTPPAGWTKTTTNTTTLTSLSAVYYGAPAPTPPAGYTLASTSSVTQTSSSSVYTGTPPAVPAGYTKTGTTTTTLTSVSLVYYGPPAPTLPTGFTLASTSTGTQTSSSGVYYGAPAPAVPTGFTKTGTSTTTLTSVSSVYYAPPGPTPPAGWSMAVPPTTSVIQTSASSAYTGAAPSVPTPGWSKTSTTITTLTSVSTAYFVPPQPTAPAGWTFASTTTTTINSTTASYLLPPAPAAPSGAGWTFVNTTTSTATSTSSPYVDTTPAPTVPTGYSLTNTTKTPKTAASAAYYNGVGEPAVPTGYTKTSTTSTTTTQTLPAGTPYPKDGSQYVYYKGNAAPAGPVGYVFSVTNTFAAGTTIKLPHPSTKPSPLAISVPPPASDASYAYNTASGAPLASSDFRMYAKEQESSSRGRLLVNGAVMAPDLGLLVTGRKDPTGKYPSNLILNYDNRVVRLLSLPNTTKFPWNVSRIGWTRIEPDRTQ